MLSASILNHVEAKSAIFDSVAELEDLELTFRYLVLLFGQVSEYILHVLNSVLYSHLLRDVCTGQLRHHSIHPWHLLKTELGVNAS